MYKTQVIIEKFCPLVGFYKYSKFEKDTYKLKQIYSIKSWGYKKVEEDIYEF